MTTVHLEQALRTLAREATTLTQKALEPLDITPLQYDILEAVARYMEHPDRHANTSTRISENVHMGRTYVSEEVRELMRRGLLRKAIGGSRLLTAHGVEALEECRIYLQGVNRTMQSYFLNDFGLEAIAEAFMRQQEGGHQQ